MIEYILDSGKKLQLVVEPKSALKKWQFVPGGELPKELLGFFTQDKYALEALSRYLERSTKVK